MPLAAEHRRVLAWVGAAYAVALAVAVAVGLLLRGHHPILVAAVADLAATLAVFAFSVARDNSSLYDPYWSVAPLPVALYWSLADGRVATRDALVLLAVLAWGARLTWNCLARWRSLDREDFRYREIRGRTGRLYWPASLFAIHLLPTTWVFLGLLPLYPALAAPVRPLGWLDLLGAAVALGGTAVEAVADRQLHRFLARRDDPAAVLDRGLWALSRHPNYLGEVLFWWGLFLLGLAADPARAWTAVGAAAITALFVLVSVPWMDRRMLAHHPAWADRMRRLPGLLPWPRRRR